MHNYPVKLALRIDWSEMDIFGHVNNVAYFKYVQAARVRYWEMSMLTLLFSEMKIGPILVSTGCQFIKQLTYPGDIVVESRIDFIKNTSFGIHHRIRNEQNEICAEASDVVVTFDFNKNEKVSVPDDFRKAVEKIEGRSFDANS